MRTQTVLVKGADITSIVDLSYDYIDITTKISGKLGYDVTEHGHPVYVLCAWNDFGIRSVYVTHSDFFEVTESSASVSKFMNSIEHQATVAEKLQGILVALNTLGLAHKELDYFVDYTRV